MNAPAVTLEVPIPRSRHLPEIDQLKGLAMILVILYHAGGVLSLPDTYHCELGVDFFVILSGVLLAFRERPESAGSFLSRHLLRIMPTYWMVFGACWWANAHFTGHSPNSFDAVIHVLGLQAWFGDLYAFSVNDSFWYITLILTLYVAYLGCRRWLDRPGPLLLFGAVVSTGFSLYFFYRGQADVFSHLGMRLPGFFLGLFIGRALRHGRLTLPLSAALGLALFLGTYPAYTQSVLFYNVAVALAVMAAYLFAWKRLVFAPLERCIAAVLSFFGVYSLEIFLLHQPLIRDYNYYVHVVILHQAAPTHAAIIWGMVIGLGVTLVLSFLLHQLMRRLPLPGRASA